MSIYIPFIHKLRKKDNPLIQLPLYIDKPIYPLYEEKQEKKQESEIIVIEL